MNESEYERRQREAALRMMKAAMPDVQRVIREIARQQTQLLDVNEIFASQYQDMFKSIANVRFNMPVFEMPKINVPTIDALKFDIPALKLDYKSLFPDFSVVHTALMKSMAPNINLIQGLQREQFADMVAMARTAMERALPPNWRGAGARIPENLESMLLDEGLPLIWVPPHAVIVKLFAADSPQARRRIISSHWKTIARSCHEELQSISRPGLAEYVEFALESTSCLLDGRPKGSQALSANLLDSVLRAKFSARDRTTITGQRDRLDIEEYPLRVALVFGGIWGCHGQYWPDKGDKIPRAFSRHGSAHGVSRRQYSRINATLALMHVTALLRLLDSGDLEY